MMILTKNWHAHLFFIQEDETHNHYVDISPYCAIFEQTWDLKGKQTIIMTYY